MIFEFVADSGKNVMKEWAEQKTHRLSARDKGALEQRLSLLAGIDRDLAIGTSLLNGPLRKAGNLYKLKAHGDKAMRPHLCTGPRDHQAEYTLLAGAVKVGFHELYPEDVESKAKERRTLLEKKTDEHREEHKPY